MGHYQIQVHAILHNSGSIKAGYGPLPMVEAPYLSWWQDSEGIFLSALIAKMK